MQWNNNNVLFATKCVELILYKFDTAKKNTSRMQKGVQEASSDKQMFVS